MMPIDSGAVPEPSPAETPSAEPAAPLEATLPEPAEQRKRGLGWLLLGSVLWPRNLFAYVRDHGGRAWLTPLALAVLLAVAGRAAALPIEKAQADAALAAIQAQLGAQGNTGNGNVQIFTAGGPGGLTGLGNTADPAANPLLAYGLPAAAVIWDWLLRGGLLLGLTWLLGGRPGPGAMFRLSGWTLVPTVARLLVALAVMLIAHREPLSGLQGFDAAPGGGLVRINVPPGDNTFTNTSINGGTGSAAAPVGSGSDALGISFLPLLRGAFLGALDLYTLWGLLLMLIGVAVTARVSVLKSLITTAGYWVISLMLTTLPPLLSFMLLTLAGPSRIIAP